MHKIEYFTGGYYKLWPLTCYYFMHSLLHSFYTKNIFNNPLAIIKFISSFDIRGWGKGFHYQYFRSSQTTTHSFSQWFWRMWLWEISEILKFTIFVNFMTLISSFVQVFKSSIHLTVIYKPRKYINYILLPNFLTVLLWL